MTSSSPNSSSNPSGNILRKYKPEEVLFNEGDPSRSIFIIKSGAISIRKTRGKSPIEVGRLKANEIIGELSFFDRLPRSATAVALIDTETVEILFTSMDKIYNSIPDYMKTIMKSLSDRLRQANEQIRVLQQKSLNSPSEDTE